MHLHIQLMKEGQWLYSHGCGTPGPPLGAPLIVPKTERTAFLLHY